MTLGTDDARELTDAERARLASLRDTERLSDLVALTGIDSVHQAYFTAKHEWDDLRARELATEDPNHDGLPGNCVVIDGREFHVHGVTHTGTAAERAYLRDHVDRFLESGAAVYCEQGLRRMYFDDVDAVCEMDDYRWAMAESETIRESSHVADPFETGFEGLVEDVDSLKARFRTVAFSLIDSDSGIDDGAFRRALGDVASSLLTGHEEIATGDEFESFRKRRKAAENPAALLDLQQYYERRFLPQPIERELLRRHDPELELVTHARNERMADYAVYHVDDATETHLIVGAAHQPGVTYYLEQHRDGNRGLGDFEPIP